MYALNVFNFNFSAILKRDLKFPYAFSNHWLHAHWTTVLRTVCAVSSSMFTRSFIYALSFDMYKYVLIYADTSILRVVNNHAMIFNRSPLTYRLFKTYFVATISIKTIEILHVYLLYRFYAAVRRGLNYDLSKK